MAEKSIKESCQERTQRIVQNFGLLAKHLDEGTPELAKKETAQILSDAKACYEGEEIIKDLIVAAVDDFKDLSKGFYYKGEAREAKQKFSLIISLLTGKDYKG